MTVALSQEPLLKVLLTPLFILVLTSSSPVPGVGPGMATYPEAALRGLEVCRASSCGTCHALRAADTHGAFGPSHDGLAETVRRRFANGSYTGAAKDMQAYLRESILTPAAYLVPEYAGSRYLIPAYTDLSPEDLDALVSLLALP